MRAPRPLLVIGFMGGRVRADNMIHKEALIAMDLRARNPSEVQVFTFANHDGALPLQSVVKSLDANHDGLLNEEEKASARIVIYGHSWGASEAIHLARELNARQIPVLLTIQVDSVQKPGENDEVIPPNVHEAMNFYQTEGLLRGRKQIRPEDPHRTTIRENRQISYRQLPVSIHEFPWYARVFMHAHIEIENDPALWSHIENAIQSEIQ